MAYPTRKNVLLITIRLLSMGLERWVDPIPRRNKMSTDSAIASLEKAVLDMDDGLAKRAAEEVLQNKLDVVEAVNGGLIKG